jgi:hypothetical protein
MWATILVFGVAWNVVAGHWWVAALSAPLSGIAFAVRSLRRSQGSRNAP